MYLAHEIGSPIFWKREKYKSAECSSSMFSFFSTVEHFKKIRCTNSDGDQIHTAISSDIS